MRMDETAEIRHVLEASLATPPLRPSSKAEPLAQGVAPPSVTPGPLPPISH